jgi:archaemetzincin
MEGKIVLVPMGPVSKDLLDWLQPKLEAQLGQPVEIGTPVSLPEKAFNPSRGQYLGDALLEELTGLKYPGARRMVGLVDADCYAPGLNFIFGQASLGGREAIVALPRLRQEYYSLTEEPNLFRNRVLKEVIHELGHTWSLTHCPDPYCVMHFSNSLPETDLKRAQFCSACQEKVST